MATKYPSAILIIFFINKLLILSKYSYKSYKINKIFIFIITTLFLFIMTTKYMHLLLQ